MRGLEKIFSLIEETIFVSFCEEEECSIFDLVEEEIGYISCKQSDIYGSSDNFSVVFKYFCIRDNNFFLKNLILNIFLENGFNIKFLDDMFFRIDIFFYVPLFFNYFNIAEEEKQKENEVDLYCYEKMLISV